MFRFLHLADVHLDTAFEGRSSALRTHLRQSLRTALRRAVDCAVDEQVDAVLVAGDLFDDTRLSFATEVFLVNQLQRLDDAGIDCVYVTGNHDPGGTGFRAADVDWPASVHVVDARTPQVLVLGGSDASAAPQARVVAAGHVSAREPDNLAAAFPPVADLPPFDGPTVGLLHAHVTSAAQVDAHDRYAPCTPADLDAAGYDYWALGHIHARQQVDAQTPAWYPGNVQGRTPRETGPKGGLLVTLRPGQAPAVAFRPFAPVRWEHLVLDALAEVGSAQALVRACRAALDARARDAQASDWLLRVTLDGPCPLVDELRDRDQTADLEAILADRLDVRDVELHTATVTPPVDVDAFRGETHLAGEVLHVIDRIRTDSAELHAVAPDVLAGRIGDDPDARESYLRSLLHELDREAISRLVAWYGDA